MPRIRTIKPEFCTSDQLAECSTTARLLFVLMWLHCDDAGRHPAKIKRLKMECFPADAFDDDTVSSWMDELINADLIALYTAENKEYWQVTGWNSHQRVDKPSYRYPPLNDGIPIPFGEHSSNGCGGVDDSSPPEQTGNRQGTDREIVDVQRSFVEWSSKNWEEVTRQANKLRGNRLTKQLPPEFIWQVAATAERFFPGMVSDLILKLEDGGIRSPKKYIEGAMRNACSEEGLNWRDVQRAVPPPPKDRAVER